VSDATRGPDGRVTPTCVWQQRIGGRSRKGIGLGARGRLCRRCGRPLPVRCGVGKNRIAHQREKGKSTSWRESYSAVIVRSASDRNGHGDDDASRAPQFPQPGTGGKGGGGACGEVACAPRGQACDRDGWRELGTGPTRPAGRVGGHSISADSWRRRPVRKLALGRSARAVQSEAQAGGRQKAGVR